MPLSGETKTTPDRELGDTKTTPDRDELSTQSGVTEKSGEGDARVTFAPSDENTTKTEKVEEEDTEITKHIGGGRYAHMVLL